VLIEAGADIDALSAPDSGGAPSSTALVHAAVYGMTEVLDVLVAAGARIDSLEMAAAGDVTGWPLGRYTLQRRLRALVFAAQYQRLEVIDQPLPPEPRSTSRTPSGDGSRCTQRPATARLPASGGCSPTARTPTCATPCTTAPRWKNASPAGPRTARPTTRLRPSCGRSPAAAPPGSRAGTRSASRSLSPAPACPAATSGPATATPPAGTDRSSPTRDSPTPKGTRCALPSGPAHPLVGGPHRVSTRTARSRSEHRTTVADRPQAGRRDQPAQLSADQARRRQPGHPRPGRDSRSSRPGRRPGPDCGAGHRGGVSLGRIAFTGRCPASPPADAKPRRENLPSAQRGLATARGSRPGGRRASTHPGSWHRPFGR
jgi:hypothetical protein